MLTGFRPTMLAARGASRAFSASATQLKKRDPTLPVPPKSPSSAYTLFVKEWFPANKDSLRPTDGKLSAAGLASAMGSAWGALTQTAKDEYAAKAKELKKAFDVEYKKWYETLTPETIKAIEKASGKKVSLPGGRAAYKKEQAARPGNPGRPLSAFFEFLKEFREKEGKSLQDIKEVARKAGEKWRQMSDAEKQRFKTIAAENKAKYEEWQKTL
ncbi:hypothetical protein EHS25_002567 [Saitozyma podzolica]|uniref:HMG box domain-containing protein n=1 Tax=Saitozyma podzolica TaxID=1890683 RepID=A0A427YCN7_9TREE|nr:hypothetical protein EHS25_002567 [Saitozyma podzolica]